MQPIRLVSIALCCGLLCLGSIFLACGGDITATIPGCETCPDRCVQDKNENKGRCVPCLRDSQCQSTNSPTQKCATINEKGDTRCICGSDKDCEGRYCRSGLGCSECAEDAHCKDGKVCTDGKCRDCRAGTSRSCQPKGLEVCKPGIQTCKGSVWRECLNWIDCKPGTQCINKACIPVCPTPGCQENQTKCTQDRKLQTCIKDTKGCLVWSEPTDCSGSQICENDACISPCSAPACQKNQTRCTQDGKLQTCAEDTKGCLAWGKSVDCPGSQRCIPSLKSCALCEPASQKPCYTGPTSTRNQGLCKDGTQTCSNDGSTYGPCMGQVLPQNETCNGKDDDCNGKVDDDPSCVCKPGDTQPCGDDTGECKKGTQTCNATHQWNDCKNQVKPITETCDGNDNDCDGQTDENLTRTCKTNCGSGIETCKSGRWESCDAPQPKSELCDGKDNDCDGKVDNGFVNLGQPCNAGTGECKQTGKYICTPDGSGTLCDVQAGKATTESCDGKDNDCDGKVDNGFANLGQSCKSGEGECKATGKYVCKNDASGTECDAKPGQPRTEVCDGKDNNCDGQIDNHCGFFWATSAGGTSNDSANSIAIDNAGNLYITGSYKGIATFGTTTLTSKGDSDIFVAKLNNQGTFLWASSAGGTSNDSAISMAIDSADNLYITGYYRATSIFGTTTLTSKGSHDMYVTKLSNQGVFLWTVSSSSMSGVTTTSIAIDSSSNLYITGYYYGAVSFRTIKLTSNGHYYDIFAAKLNNQGAFLWATSAGGTDYDEPRGITVDSSGNLYITGGFTSGTAIFGTTTLTSKGSYEIFVAKLSNQGTFLWAHSAGGTSNDHANSIAIDSVGNLYITGHYEGLSTFGTTTLTSKGGSDIFVARLSNQGTFLWATSAGGTSNDHANSIAIDNADNLHITGYYGAISTFGTTTLTSKGNGDIFVAKLNNQGTFLWASSAGGTSNDSANSIAIDNTDNLYITGYYGVTSTFGTTTLTAKGNGDIFVTKYR